MEPVDQVVRHCLYLFIADLLVDAHAVADLDRDGSPWLDIVSSDNTDGDDRAKTVTGQLQSLFERLYDGSLIETLVDDHRQNLAIGSDPLVDFRVLLVVHHL